MKIVTKKVTFYRCEICKTEYESKKQCAYCENSPTEKKLFKAGDKVKNIFHVCSDTLKAHHLTGGVVIKITGPEPCEWGGRHILWYEIRFYCPYCKQIINDVDSNYRSEGSLSIKKIRQ